MFDLDSLAEYAGATSDPLALQLVTLAHNVENYANATENDNGTKNFAPVDTSAGVGSVNPQHDSGTGEA